MNFSVLVKSRLAALGYGQKDLARAVQVTDSYSSQRLARKKAPPDRDRTTEEIRRRLGQAPEPLFRKFRDLVLNKCVPQTRDEVRTVLEGQPFGILERLVVRHLLEVVQQIARTTTPSHSVEPTAESWPLL